MIPFPRKRQRKSNFQYKFNEHIEHQKIKSYTTEMLCKLQALAIIYSHSNFTKSNIPINSTIYINQIFHSEISLTGDILLDIAVKYE